MKACGMASCIDKVIMTIPPQQILLIVQTMIFKDQAALDSALAAAGPALENIPNFFSEQPQMLIGKVQE